jgi:hypothetical protein
MKMLMNTMFILEVTPTAALYAQVSRNYGSSSRARDRLPLVAPVKVFGIFPEINVDPRDDPVIAMSEFSRSLLHRRLRNRAPSHSIVDLVALARET